MSDEYLPSADECPRCMSDSRVLESRKLPDAIRRRRSCSSHDCSHRWTTYEVAAADSLEPGAIGHGTSVVVITTNQLKAIRTALRMLDGLIGDRARPRGKSRDLAQLKDVTPEAVSEVARCIKESHP